MSTPLTNTVEGILTLEAAAASLTVGRLAYIDANGKAALATTSTAPARFVVVDSDPTRASLVPIEPGRQVRVALAGTCNAGDGLAANADSKAAVAAGTSTVVLIAEEDGVDGQDVLARGPAMIETEIPPTTSGDENKILAVNADRSALEWVEKPAGTPAIASGDALKVLRVNSGETTTEWAAPASGLPEIVSGDAGKVLAVKGDETGVEYQTKHGLSAAMGSVKDVYATRQNGEITEATWLNLLSALNLIGADLPTSDPYNTGQWWNDGGTVKISGGI